MVIIAFLVATAIFFVSAQSDKLSHSPPGELPDPGITPRNPFYFVDTITENFLLFLYAKPHLKARVAFRIAKEKLSEVTLLEANFEQASFASEQINRRAAEKSRATYDTYLNIAYRSALASDRAFLDKTQVKFEYETLDALLSGGAPGQTVFSGDSIRTVWKERFQTEIAEARTSIADFFRAQIQKIKGMTATFLKRKTNEAIDDLLNATSSQ